MTPPDEQLYLFTESEQRQFRARSTAAQYPTHPHLESHTLQQWKETIATFQQEVRSSQVEEQGTLFDLARSTANPTAIDPFCLQLHNFFFFEQPAHHYPSKPCIYFVIDLTLPLILYIGETVKANQRWKGIHDCKRYVLNYRDAHFRSQIPTAINTAFYWDTPADVRPRQALEYALITRWRSPFNKENWDFWGTPFVGGKGGAT